MRIIRFLIKILSALGIIVLLMAAWLWPRHPFSRGVAPAFDVQRLADLPIVSTDHSASLQALASQQGYSNINGPSLIRVPDWIEQPLGKYYLYFAHHKGDYIRLAYADEPAGPWQINETGTLQLADSGFPVDTTDFAPEKAMGDLWKHFSVHVFRDFIIMARRAMTTDAKIRKARGIPAEKSQTPHIASPDVIVDHQRRQIRMYYHGLGDRGYQYTRMATSDDGINFTKTDVTVPAPYVRSFTYGGEEFLLAMPGVLFKKESDSASFIPRRKSLFDPTMRHSAVRVEGQTLQVFWSRVGDAPEAILYSQVDLRDPDWNTWSATEPVLLITPMQPWEGATLPPLASYRGEVTLPSNDVRDPAVFDDDDGKVYLLYSGGGEQALGIAELVTGGLLDK